MSYDDFVTDVKRTVGKRIKIARIEREIRQGDLAELLGVNQQNVARMESGRFGIGVETLARVAQALRKPIAYFFEEFEEVEIKNVSARRRKAA